jgi:arabinose-5-phosphate isomerase
MAQSISFPPLSAIKPAANQAANTFASVGARVLRIEASGLELLADSLGAQFDTAVETLAAVKGRIVLTGMGKSGHICHKIAATLSSTGSPALFVHPAEAAHGDLGMIAKNDAIIALSDSGESAELTSVLDYARRNAIPVIGITRNAASTLGEASTVVLQLPAAEPACPLRLAPTTSTTMMLGLGDAIAVALMEKRGFEAEDFKEFHPGGQLGKRLQRVQDIMNRAEALPLVSVDTPMQDVVLEITAKRLGCAGVIDEAGNLLGIITDGDLRRHMQRDLRDLTAAHVMSRRPKTLKPEAFLADALSLMENAAITVLFVVSPAGEPVGVVHIHDLLRAGAA